MQRLRCSDGLLEVEQSNSLHKEYICYPTSCVYSPQT